MMTSDRHAAIVTAGSATELRFAYRELLTPGMMALAVGITASLLQLFVAAGPMGTGQTLSLVERLAYWGLVGALELPICYAMGVLTLYLVRDRPHRQVVFALAVAALIVAAPCAAITYSIYALFHPGPPGATLPAIYTANAANLLSLSVLMYYVLCLRQRLTCVAAAGDDAAGDHVVTAADGPAPRPATGSVAGAPVAATDGAGNQPFAAGTVARNEQRTGATSHAAPSSLLLARLPDWVGCDVVYLKMAGHYVEVVTTVASTTILMRLADAIAHLGEQGMRVHRSYWVAHRHVTGVLRRDRRTVLQLTGNHEVPVSRTYLSAVRTAANAAYKRSAAPASAR